MKLRIQGNSVRLRLTEPEVRLLAERGVVEEVTRFPGAAELRYRVECGPAANGVHVGLVKSCLWVRLPRDGVARWARSSEVGIEGTQALPDGEVLRVVVEKDFECLHKPDASAPGSYPNPAGGSR